MLIKLLFTGKQKGEHFEILLTKNEKQKEEKAKVKKVKMTKNFN